MPKEKPSFTVTFHPDTPLWELHRFAASHGCALVWDRDLMHYVEKKIHEPKPIHELVRRAGDAWRLELRGPQRRSADANATTEYWDFIHSTRADFKAQAKHLSRESLGDTTEDPELRVYPHPDETTEASK